MSTPVSELTENDYKILEYISRFPSVHRSDIEQHFNGKIDTVGYRLTVLSKPIRSKGNFGVVIPNSSYIIEEFEEVDDDYDNPPKSLNSFCISELGKTTLQNPLIQQNANTKLNRRELFFKIGNFTLSIIAIIISIIALLRQ